MFRVLTLAVLFTSPIFSCTELCKAEELSFTDPFVEAEAQNKSYSQLAAWESPCGSGCDDVCCDTGCCKCGSCKSTCCKYPGWTVKVDALFMERSRPDGLILAREVGAPPNAVVLNASEFDLGVQAGPRVSFIRHTRTGCDLEFTYFGIDGFNDSIVVPGSNFIPAGGGDFFLGAGPATFDYDSQLYNLEINVTSPHSDTLTFLAGFRWMELNEQFAASIPANPNLYSLDSNNHLYGIQIGGIVTPIQADRFSTEVRVLGGAYHNNMTVGGQIFNGATQTGSDRQHALAFVGELSLTGIYQCTDSLALRFGYQLMIIDNVALAPDQIIHQDTTARTIEVVDTGSLLYHGGFSGLEWSW